MDAANIVRIVLSALLALLLVSTGGGKLAGAKSSLGIRDSLHVPAGRWRLIGVAELVIVVLLVVGIWLPPVGALGCAGALVLMLGAVVVRLRAGGDQRRTGLPVDAVVAVVAVLAGVLSAIAAV